MAGACASHVVRTQVCASRWGVVGRPGKGQRLGWSRDVGGLGIGARWCHRGQRRPWGGA